MRTHCPSPLRSRLLAWEQLLWPLRCDFSVFIFQLIMLDLLVFLLAKAMEEWVSLREMHCPSLLRFKLLAWGQLLGPLRCDSHCSCFGS